MKKKVYITPDSSLILPGGTLLDSDGWGNGMSKHDTEDEFGKEDDFDDFKDEFDNSWKSLDNTISDEDANGRHSHNRLFDD